ncbi:3-oxoadipate enol-lactonase [Fuscovulum ytuae]|uniref:3-oxoadipate enol-lactonase n=1 Tax=Fuscovulum ytuae TaxID=3042299 RepID=A0ABY8Q407_9RHOB|nr:3-oxoadipate enol-lactonase [Fuscovulum sp. YMD61]WGV15012.1 3-oxoadipate enol-lactonase [Fuscovulum sp. YMD61]
MSVLMRPWGHLHYRLRGPDAGLPVILLNSLGTDLRMWEGVADRLPDLRLIGMDKRGHGLSATPTDVWTLDDLAGDALALMDHLGVDRAVVAGCSIGGMIAQRMATLAPSRIAGLFLSNTAMKVGTDESWAARIAGITEQGLRGMAAQIMDRWFAPAFRASDEAKAWETMLMRGDNAGYIGACRVLAAADLRTTSPAIACPVLLVGGTTDASTPEELVRATAVAINGARVEIIQGSGHIPAIDNPDITARLLADFHRGLA